MVSLDIDVYRVIPILTAFFPVFAAGGMCLSIGQMSAISELSKAAGKASSAFGFLQIAFASLPGYLVGSFYDKSVVPATAGVIASVLMSATGYLIVRTMHIPITR